MSFNTLFKASLVLIGFLSVGWAQLEEDFIDISPLPTVFETTSLPADEDGNFLNRLMASVGNGHVSTTVYTDTVFMNGLYNGFKGESHRARIPSRNNVRVTVPDGVEVTNHTFALDVEKGTFFERFIASNYWIEQRTFAHRFYHKVIVTQIVARPLSSDSGILELDLTSNPGAPSDDVTFDIETEYDSVIPSVYTCGKTVQVEDPTYQDKNPTACVISSIVPTKIHLDLKEESIFTYFASYDVDITGASDDFDAVVQVVNSGGHGQLFDTHVQAWKAVWDDGRIELEGNVQLGKVIYGALYYILSSLPVTTDTNSPVGQFYGLSPGGLAYGTYLNDYQGHSFWDTETWMYPSILYFYPEAAREILNYRLHVLQAARDRAVETGYSGARFPWESCFTGREVTPDCCPETRDFQIHITGDIAFAIRQYIATTRDEDWLKINQPSYSANGCGLIHEIAEFWVSRATFNATTGHYDINGVMPPDEDHHDVNNSVYTNIIAGYAIFFAKYAECLCGSSMTPIPDDWVELAKSLTLLYDSELDYHPEYDGYTPGISIKQADVVLLGFPLMYNMPAETRKNDLLMYENVTRPSGPAMTWAMHTVGFLELDDLNKAEGLYNRSYQSYMRQPYKVWTEAQPPTIGAMNFITGMGGFLQSIVSGYGGIRLRPESLTFMKPRVPPGSTALKLIGLNYLENKFDLHVEETKILIKITDASNKYPITATMEDGTPIPFMNNEAVISTESGPVTFKFSTDTLTSCPLPIDEIGGVVPFRKIFLTNEVDYLKK